MKYARIPGIDKDVSRIVQGAIMLDSETEAENFALFDAIFDMGCTTFDTAHVYGSGESERVLGRWIARRGIRDRAVILDKGAHLNQDRRRVTPFDIAADVHDSLARLQTDYIDLYLLHRDDPGVPVGPIVEALNEHQTAGRIHAFGASNWTAARIAEANAYAAAHGLTPFAVSSPHFSLARQIEEPWPECVTITGEDNADQRAWYAAQGMPVFCWSSLAGGWFSGRLERANTAEHADTLYMRCYGCEDNWQRLERARELGRERGLSEAQIAFAWVLRQPMDCFPPRRRLHAGRIRREPGRPRGFAERRGIGLARFAFQHEIGGFRNAGQWWKNAWGLRPLCWRIRGTGAALADCSSAFLSAGRTRSRARPRPPSV